jgi:radical SAM superfamily enzyme YgiQ (UPF0313 family)
LSDKREIKKVLDFEAEVIGGTCYTANFLDLLNLLKRYKKKYPRALSIVGGPHVSMMDKSSLQEECIDIVVRGEGEKTMEEICSKKPLGKIFGITFKNGINIIRNPNRPLMEKLCSLPLPAYHLLLGSYQSKVWHLQTSKGCPFNCSFCCEGALNGKKIRFKEPKKIIEEIRLLNKLFDCKRVFFIDDTFTFKKEHVFNLCNELKKLNFLKWDCETRVDRVNSKLLKEMKGAGCRMLYFGIESGSQEILDKNNKNIKIEKVVWACKLAKRFGFYITANIIIGLPGENKKTFNESLNFIRMLIKNKLVDVVSPYIFTPYPGTPIFQKPKNYDINILDKMNWDKYREDFYPIIETEFLSSEEIYLCWLKMTKEITRLQKGLSNF